MGRKKKQLQDSGTCLNCRTLEGKLADLFDRLQEKESIIQDLTQECIGLRADLQNAVRTQYIGVEGARRWLADHIGYDLRQVAKCPVCLSFHTAPTHPEKIGATFICKECGQVFFVIKTLSTTPEAVRAAYYKAQQEEDFVGEVVPVEEDPYRTAGRVWPKMLPKQAGGKQSNR